MTLSEGLREYVVSPLLLSCIGTGQFARRKLQLQNTQPGEKRFPETLNWSDMRIEKLPDTTLSGAITGSIFNSWKREFLTVDLFHFPHDCI